MTDFNQISENCEHAALLLGTHPAVMILDGAGRIVQINQAYLALTGHRRADLIGQRITVLLDAATASPAPLGQIIDQVPAAQFRGCDSVGHVTAFGLHFRMDIRIMSIRAADDALGLNIIFAKETDGALGAAGHLFWQGLGTEAAGADDAAAPTNRH